MQNNFNLKRIKFLVLQDLTPGHQDVIAVIDKSDDFRKRRPFSLAVHFTKCDHQDSNTNSFTICQEGTSNYKFYYDEARG